MLAHQLNQRWKIRRTGQTFRPGVNAVKVGAKTQHMSAAQLGDAVDMAPNVFQNRRTALDQKVAVKIDAYKPAALYDGLDLILI